MVFLILCTHPQVAYNIEYYEGDTDGWLEEVLKKMFENSVILKISNLHFWPETGEYESE